MLRGSTGNYNSNFTTNALTTLPYYVTKQLTQLFLMNIITRAFRALVQHIHCNSNCLTYHICPPVSMTQQIAFPYLGTFLFLQSVLPVHVIISILSSRSIVVTH